MNMGSALLSLVLCTAAALQTRQEVLQLEMNDAIPYDENAVGYDCGSVRLPALLAVCRLCDASAAYAVYHGEVDYLTGLYSDEVEMLGRAVEQVRDQLPTANYTIAFRGTEICIAAMEIDGKPNFQRVFSQFSHISEGELEVPELFSREAYAELDFIAMKTTDRTDDQYQYEGLTVSYRTDDQVTVSDRLTLSLEALTVVVEGEAASVAYTGLAMVGDGLHPFTLSVAYARPAHTPFIVSIVPAEALPAEVWLAAVGSQCSDIVEVPGLPPLTTQPLSLVNLVYAFNEESSVMELSLIVGFFPVPAVAVLPHILLSSPTGQFVVTPSDHSCSLTVSSPSPYTYPLSVTLTADSSQWLLTAGLQTDGITVAEVEASFYTDFFAGIGHSLLPMYEESTNQDFLARLSALKFANFTVRLVPEPVLSLSIRGEVAWGGNPSTPCELVIGWVNATVESVLVLSAGEDTDYIPGDPSITVVSSHLVSSTASIDLQTYPHMRGVGNGQVPAWKLGLYGDVVVTGNENCGEYDFCAIVTASNTPAFFLAGMVTAGQLVLSTAVNDIALSDGLEMTEAEVVVETSPTATSLYVQGAVVVTATVHRNSVVRLVGRLTDTGGAALLEARSEDRWESGVSGLTVGRVEVREFVGREGGVQTVTVRGEASVGECVGTEDCITGAIELHLDPVTFSPVQCILHTSSVTLPQFSSSVLSLALPSLPALPFALTGLSFNTSLDIEFLGQSGELGVVVTGPVDYFGVHGWMETLLDRLGGDNPVLTIDLDEFYVEDVGLWVSPQLAAPLLVTLYLDETQGIAGYVTGLVEFWDFSSLITIRVGDSGMLAEFAGRMPGSDYNVAFSLTASGFDSFAGVNGTLVGEISVEQLRSEEAAVRTDLLFWVNQGLAALDTIDMWKDNATITRAVSEGLLCPSTFCPEEYNCVAPPTVQCKLYAQEQVCVQEKTACTGGQQVCASEQSVCLVWGQECEDWEGSVCLQWKDKCEDYMKVCQQWEWKCDGENQTSCETYEVRTLPDQCIEYEETCEMGSYINPGCIARCLQTQTELSNLIDLENKYKHAYDAVLPQLVGFMTMTEHVPSEQYRSDLFYLNSITFPVDLSLSSLSLLNVTVSASFSTYNAIENEDIETVNRVGWSWTERELNERELFRAVKRTLVDNSGGMLAERLAVDTALELIEDELYRVPTAA